MKISKGDIFLANLNPQRKKEIRKIRPVLVIQNDIFMENGYPTTLIMPLSTELIDDAKPLRYRIRKREKLQKDSDVLIAHIRAIDNNRFIEYLGKVSDKEIEEILQLLDDIIK